MPLRYLERDITRLPQYNPLPAEHLAGLANTIEQQHQQGVSSLYGGGGSSGTRSERGQRTGHHDFQTLEENILAQTAGLPDAYKGHVRSQLEGTYRDLESIADEKGYRSLGPLVQRRGRELSRQLRPFVEDAGRIRGLQEQIQNIEGHAPDYVKRNLLSQITGMPEDGEIFDPASGEYRSSLRDVSIPTRWIDINKDLQDFASKIETDTDADRFLTSTFNIEGYDKDGVPRMGDNATEYFQRLVHSGRSEDKIAAAMIGRITSDVEMSRQISLELESLGIDPSEVVAMDGETPITAYDQRIMELVSPYVTQRTSQNIQYQNLQAPRTAAQEEASARDHTTRRSFATTIQLPDSPFDSLGSLNEITEGAQSSMNTIVREAEREARRLNFGGVHVNEETGELRFTDEAGNPVEPRRDSKGNIIPNSAEAMFSMQYKQNFEQIRQANQARDEAVRIATDGEITSWEQFTSEYGDHVEEASRQASAAARRLANRKVHWNVFQTGEQWAQENPEEYQSMYNQEFIRWLSGKSKPAQKVEEALKDMAQRGEMQVQPFMFEIDAENKRMEDLYERQLGGHPHVAVHDVRTGKEIIDELPPTARFNGFFLDDDGQIKFLYRDTDPDVELEDRKEMMVPAPPGTENDMIAAGNLSEARIVTGTYVRNAFEHPGLDIDVPIGDYSVTLKLIPHGQTHSGRYQITVPDRRGPLYFDNSEEVANFLFEAKLDEHGN